MTTEDTEALEDTEVLVRHVPKCKLVAVVRDVNFVFFQKSIIVLKKIDFFFDYRICASLTVQRHY